MRSNVIWSIARKELALFFSSPIGYLFLLAYLGLTLFVFFWGEAFFARNIADVRPMFEWMPVLLVFLSAAITMRMWSEERRTGTLEFVSTVPARSGSVSSSAIPSSAQQAMNLPTTNGRFSNCCE